MGRAARRWQLRRCMNRWSAAIPQPNDLSRSLVALDQNSTIIAVVELSQSSWLVGGVLPGIERQPRKKLEPSPERLLAMLHRWRDEAVRDGRNITRIVLAFEAGRDGFWLARWLERRGVEAHVIHPSSVAVSREHRRAKTDRLDTELLKRGFLGCHGGCSTRSCDFMIWVHKVSVPLSSTDATAPFARATFHWISKSRRESTSPATPTLWLPSVWEFAHRDRLFHFRRRAEG
jgi:hypothetical protein